MAPDANLAYLSIPKMEALDQTPPCWWGEAGSLTCARFVCKCGRTALLSDTHHIDTEGRVCPGVRCQHCGFQAHLKLEGWGATYAELFFPRRANP